eukprot:COSAG02_NODE_873_length_16302_cov_113.473616_2_plen_104_part_00
MQDEPQPGHSNGGLPAARIERRIRRGGAARAMSGRCHAIGLGAEAGQSCHALGGLEGNLRAGTRVSQVANHSEPLLAHFMPAPAVNSRVAMGRGGREVATAWW